jgi:GNAT superfamily N-acetyltransferase
VAQFHSLALQSETALWATRGSIVPRLGYWVVRTPSDPTYFYGNLLLLPEAPLAETIPLWQARFAEEFASTVQHTTLWWDTGELSPVAVREFNHRGFTVETTEVLRRDPGLPWPAAATPLGPDIHIREISASETPLLAELADRLSDRHDAVFMTFLQRRARWQAQLIQRGLAHFFACFADQRVVASLGIFGHDGLARYQDVQTDAAYRRRGLATALVGLAGQHHAVAAATMLTIHTEPNSDAARLYRQLGFGLVETTTSVCRYPRSFGPNDTVTPT